jgi:hypothetical protein
MQRLVLEVAYDGTAFAGEADLLKVCGGQVLEWWERSVVLLLFTCRALDREHSKTASFTCRFPVPGREGAHCAGESQGWHHLR